MLFHGYYLLFNCNKMKISYKDTNCLCFIIAFFVGNHVENKNRANSLVHMPPELLIPIDLPADVLRVFYLFPSLMYRIESLMLASQLRSEIAYTGSDISSFLV